MDKIKEKQGRTQTRAFQVCRNGFSLNDGLITISRKPFQRGKCQLTAIQCVKTNDQSGADPRSDVTVSR